MSYMCHWFRIKCFWALSFSGVLSAQVIQLDTVRIYADRTLSHFAMGVKRQTFDSIQITNATSLGDLLSRNSEVYVKQYSPGNLATTSFRGGSAEHTQVTWQGLTLNSPMNGQIDFSLLSPDLFEDVTLFYGGNGTLGGSGAVSGVIALSQSTSSPNQVKVIAGIRGGSFGQQRYTLRVKVPIRKAWMDAGVWEEKADNNFLYYNTAVSESPKVRQQHSGFKSMGFLGSGGYHFSARTSIQFNFWHQETYRQIPGLMTAPNRSSAHQLDFADRGLLTFTYQPNPQWTTQIRTGLQQEKLTYKDRSSQLLSQSNAISKSIQGEIRYIKKTLEVLLTTEIRGVEAIIESEDLSVGIRNNSYLISPGTQERYTAFTTIRKRINAKGIVSSGLRLEQVHNPNRIYNIPILPSVGLEYNLPFSLTLKANAAKLYRVPTLNELFWYPGGNPDLKPEQGYHLETGILGSWQTQSWKWEPEISIWFRYLDQQIRWTPQATVWTARNLEQVEAKGLENKLRISFLSGKWFYQVEGRYLFNSTKAAGNPHQSFYVPQNTMGGSFKVSFQKWRVEYAHNWTGFVNTTSDASQFLPSWQTGEVNCSRSFSWGNYSIQGSAQIRNCWNAQYMVVQWMAMPLRYCLLGLKVTWGADSKSSS